MWLLTADTQLTLAVLRKGEVAGEHVTPHGFTCSAVCTFALFSLCAERPIARLLAVVHSQSHHMGHMMGERVEGAGTGAAGTGGGGVLLEKTPVSAASLTPSVELLARQETTGSSSKTHLPTTEVAPAQGGWQLLSYSGF